nr:hypothetical protein CFP56_78515 [Quercus suber]
MAHSCFGSRATMTSAAKCKNKDYVVVSGAPKKRAEEDDGQTDNEKILAVPAEVVSVLAVGLRGKLWLESFFNRDGY